MSLSRLIPSATVNPNRMSFSNAGDTDETTSTMAALLRPSASSITAAATDSLVSKW